MAQIKKTTETKTVETPVKEEVKTTTTKKAPAKKPAAKATTAKETATTKTAAKTTTKKATTAKTKETVEKPAATKKTTTTKTTTKKAPAKRTAKASEPTVSVVVEFDGGQEKVNEIIENIKTVYASKENAKEIKTLEVFIKPEERKAFFIVNGELDSENQMDVYF